MSDIARPLSIYPLPVAQFSAICDRRVAEYIAGFLISMDGKVVHDWNLPISQIWEIPTASHGRPDSSRGTMFISTRMAICSPYTPARARRHGVMVW
jgi:hypothetical protein